MNQLIHDYPWTQAPLISCAPMRLISLAALAVEVSGAGGLGFVGAGNDASQLSSILEEVRTRQSESPSLKDVRDVLPVGVGFLLWAGDALLTTALPILQQYVPAAVWLFAPNQPQQVSLWAREVRRVTNDRTKIWVQVGTVADATDTVLNCRPDVVVVQGQDAGGHGLRAAAGLVPLLPEVDDAVTLTCKQHDIAIKPWLVATGGIMDGRGVAAAMVMGAAGVTLGTRYLASPEANIAKGYRSAVLEASDGGVTTVRGSLYDTLRGTTDWPAEYGGRGVLNESYFDAEKGLGIEENKQLYDNALKKGDGGWGKNARLATYAGTGVGLVKHVLPAARITEELRKDCLQILRLASSGT